MDGDPFPKYFGRRTVQKDKHARFEQTYADMSDWLPPAALPGGYTSSRARGAGAAKRSAHLVTALVLQSR